MSELTESWSSLNSVTASERHLLPLMPLNVCTKLPWASQSLSGQSSWAGIPSHEHSRQETGPLDLLMWEFSSEGLVLFMLTGISEFCKDLPTGLPMCVYSASRVS